MIPAVTASEVGKAQAGKRRSNAARCGLEMRGLGGEKRAQFCWKAGRNRVRAPWRRVFEFSTRYNRAASSRAVWECSSKARGRDPARLNRGARPIEYKYCEGKTKSTLKRELNERETDCVQGWLWGCGGELLRPAETRAVLCLLPTRRGFCG